MEFERLRPALEQIRMPDDAKRRVAAALAEKAEAPRRSGLRRGPVLALAVLVLLLALAMPVFASVEPIYRLMYLVSPAVAQFFRPVQQSCEDQGIRMEVVSVYIRDDTAQIYLTVQDVTGGHTDGPVDLNDSYAIRSPFDCAESPFRWASWSAAGMFMRVSPFPLTSPVWKKPPGPRPCGPSAAAGRAIKGTPTARGCFLRSLCPVRRTLTFPWRGSTSPGRPWWRGSCTCRPR